MADVTPIRDPNALGVPRRTLQRRLAVEGTSLHRETEEIRRTMAMAVSRDAEPLRVREAAPPPAWVSPDQYDDENFVVTFRQRVLRDSERAIPPGLLRRPRTGKSYEEAANQFGVTPKTVQYHIGVANRAFRKEFEALGIGVPHSVTGGRPQGAKRTLSHGVAGPNYRVARAIDPTATHKDVIRSLSDVVRPAIAPDTKRIEPTQRPIAVRTTHAYRVTRHREAVTPPKDSVTQDQHATASPSRHPTALKRCVR